MKPQKEGPEKYYTMTPSVVVFRLVEQPVSLLILQYVLIRRKIYDQFRVKDMARQLKKDERTIRAALKPLRKLELLVLKGELGTQYYEFNESKYQAYMLINPFASGDAPSQKMGVVPSQELGGVGIANNEGRPLSKSEGVKSKGIEERESKETERVLSFVGSQPPSTAAVAPEPSMNLDLAEQFDRLFDETPLASAPSSGESQAAAGGGAFGVPSTPVASSSPSTTIQGACGKSNDGGANELDVERPLAAEPLPFPSAAGDSPIQSGGPMLQSATVPLSASGEANTGHPGANAGLPGSAGQVPGSVSMANASENLGDEFERTCAAMLANPGADPYPKAKDPEPCTAEMARVLRARFGGGV